VDEGEWPKSKCVDVLGALRAGLNKLVAATQLTMQGIASSEIVQGFWASLQACPFSVPSLPCKAILLYRPRTLLRGTNRVHTALDWGICQGYQKSVPGLRR
jgi:hypothetical protein